MAQSTSAADDAIILYSSGSIVYDEFRGLPPPYVFGYILLDGADTAIGSYFKGVDFADPDAAAQRLKVGTRIMTKFAEKRTRVTCSTSGSSHRRERRLHHGDPRRRAG